VTRQTSKAGRGAWRGLALGVFVLGALPSVSGCISVPDELRAEFDAPKGRPNNFGVLARTTEGLIVRPDNPTSTYQEVQAPPPARPKATAPAAIEPRHSSEPGQRSGS
jgi:hypothetical protein